MQNALIKMGLMLMFLVPMHASASVSQNDPKEMVQQLSDQILVQIDTRRAELNQDPSEVKRFANEYVLPYVDTYRMSRYVMGKYWKRASDNQQKAFVDAFTNTLMRSYSKSLLKLNVTKMDITKVIEKKKGRVSITTSVTQSDGNESKVIYAAYLSKKKQKWFLYDVTIEGISLLVNYRKTFSSEFKQKGIDQTIDDMIAKNQKNGFGS